MKQPRDQHWVEFLGAVETEADMLPHGCGGVTLRIRFHDGQPREIEVLERTPKYLIARGGTARQA